MDSRCCTEAVIANYCSSRFKVFFYQFHKIKTRFTFDYREIFGNVEFHDGTDEMNFVEKVHFNRIKLRRYVENYVNFIRKLYFCILI